MTNVFTYGSLMFEPVWTRVVMGNYQSQQATIKGFKRYAVIGEDFPVIVPSAKTDTLDGALYLNITDDDLKLLDNFESYFYFRQSVDVEGCSSLTAEVYVLDPDYIHVTSNELWSPNEFKQFGLERFIRRFS